MAPRGEPAVLSYPGGTLGGVGVDAPADGRTRAEESPVTQRADLPAWPCPDCGQETDFEQPPCADGHTEDGGDCPEWVCVDCGTALEIGRAHV